jgi:hypothetical protein
MDGILIRHILQDSGKAILKIQYIIILGEYFWFSSGHLRKRTNPIQDVKTASFGKWDLPLC